MICSIALPISHEVAALPIAIVVSLQKKNHNESLFAYRTVFILERRIPTTRLISNADDMF